jgi:hypothetical protein
MYSDQKQKIIDKVNERQESDVEKYTWETISYSLRLFWTNWFREQKNVTLPITKIKSK